MLTEAKFQEVYQSYRPLLYYIMKNLGVTGAEADDVYQDVFARLWRFRHRYEEQGQIKAFLVTVTRNVTLNYIKKRSITPGFKGLDLETLEKVWGEEAQFFEETYSDAMQRALAKVPKDQRDVLVLYASGAGRIEDVAEMLDIPMGTALSRSHRARAALRKYYREAS